MGFISPEIRSILQLLFQYRRQNPVKNAKTDTNLSETLQATLKPVKNAKTDAKTWSTDAKTWSVGSPPQVAKNGAFRRGF